MKTRVEAPPDPPTSTPAPSRPIRRLRMKVSELQAAAAPYNPRAITPKARRGLRASLRRFGMLETPIYNQRTQTLVGGHRRVELLAEDGVVETEVTVVDLPLAEEKALNLTLNNPKAQGHFTNAMEDLVIEIEASLDSLVDELHPGVVLADLLDELQLADYLPEQNQKDLADQLEDQGQPEAPPRAWLLASGTVETMQRLYELLTSDPATVEAQAGGLVRVEIAWPQPT